MFTSWRTWIGALAVLSVLFGPLCSAGAGGLDAPAAPADPASAMYTFQDLYERLATGEAGAKRAGPFAEPASGPTAGTMRTLNEIMARAPMVNANAAAAEDVVGGKAYWGLKTNDWGGKTGAMPRRTLSAATNAMPAGYYGMTDLTEVDPDLAINNIRSGVGIFGVVGLPEVVDTSSGDATADTIVVGKKAWVAGAEVAGNLPAGASVTGAMGALVVAIPNGVYSGSKTAAVADTNLAPRRIVAGATIFGVAGTLNTNIYARPAKTGQAMKSPYDDGWWSTNDVGFAWPSPRFAVQADTNLVVDNLTGLMWARNANLFSVAKDWPTAVTTGNGADLGGFYDWRLPNINELRSLLDLRVSGTSPKLPVGHPFVNVQNVYWSGTTSAGDTNSAWTVRVSDTSQDPLDAPAGKGVTYFVWPVRGGP